MNAIKSRNEKRTMWAEYEAILVSWYRGDLTTEEHRAAKLALDAKYAN
jgi:hypothetical protein